MSINPATLDQVISATAALFMLQKYPESKCNELDQDQFMKSLGELTDQVQMAYNLMVEKMTTPEKETKR